LNWYVPEAIKIIGQIALCPRHMPRIVHVQNLQMQLPTLASISCPKTKDNRRV